MALLLFCHYECCNVFITNKQLQKYFIKNYLKTSSSSSSSVSFLYHICIACKEDGYKQLIKKLFFFKCRALKGQCKDKSIRIMGY